jgi:hypothetical protein
MTSEFSSLRTIAAGDAIAVGQHDLVGKDGARSTGRKHSNADRIAAGVFLPSIVPAKKPGPCRTQPQAFTEPELRPEFPLQCGSP